MRFKKNKSFKVCLSQFFFYLMMIFKKIILLFLILKITIKNKERKKKLMNLYLLLRYYYLKNDHSPYSIYNLIINRSKKIESEIRYSIFLSIFTIGFPFSPPLLFIYIQRLSGNI